MSCDMKLSQLDECESAIIKSINIYGSMRIRLQDLGMITGTRVKCVFKNFNGKISAYNIRGAVIALRKTEADFIDIALVERKC